MDWLPLALFDDSTFDDYQGQEWIDKKIDEDNYHRIITGRGLKENTNGLFSWNPVVIESYNDEKRKFIGKWKD